MSSKTYSCEYCQGDPHYKALCRCTFERAKDALMQPRLYSAGPQIIVSSSQYAEQEKHIENKDEKHHPILCWYWCHDKEAFVKRFHKAYENAEERFKAECIEKLGEATYNNIPVEDRIDLVLRHAELEEQERK